MSQTLFAIGIGIGVWIVCTKRCRSCRHRMDRRSDYCEKCYTYQ
jgi:hypothetical protein